MNHREYIESLFQEAPAGDFLSTEGSGPAPELTLDDLIGTMGKLREDYPQVHYHLVPPDAQPGDLVMCASCLKPLWTPDALR